MDGALFFDGVKFQIGNEIYLYEVEYFDEYRDGEYDNFLFRVDHEHGTIECISCYPKRKLIVKEIYGEFFMVWTMKAGMRFEKKIYFKDCQQVFYDL